MAESQPARRQIISDLALSARNCASVVLGAYAVSLKYSHDEDKAFNVAVRAWRLHNRSLPPDDAPREVALILHQQGSSPAPTCRSS
jgi:hypothetical protein